MPTMSRQQVWQKRRKDSGLCSRCGKPRNLYSWFCDACAGKQREYQRERRGCGRRNKTLVDKADTNE